MDDPTLGDHERFVDVKQPVYIQRQRLRRWAHPYAAESTPFVLSEDTHAVVVVDDSGVYLDTHLPEAFSAILVAVVTGSELPAVRIVGAEFDGERGDPLVVDVDVLGDRKVVGRAYPAGPIATLAAGATRTRLW